MKPRRDVKKGGDAEGMNAPVETATSGAAGVVGGLRKVKSVWGKGGPAPGDADGMNAHPTKLATGGAAGVIVGLKKSKA